MRYAPSLRRSNHDALWSGMTPLAQPETAVFTKELRHRVVISYHVPCERLRALVPDEFDLAATTRLTIESFLDCGRTSFVQTNYRLHVSQHGKPCHWLFGLSLGSLSGVTARHLYPLPWHLSAMELQVTEASRRANSRRYRLRSQSEWANAEWDILDTGQSCWLEEPVVVTDRFVRRDGALGTYQTIYQTIGATVGQLQTGRCDLLEALGILSSDEINRPAAVALQRAVRCEIKPATYSHRVRLAV
jgi:Uncharacterized conserved protein (COG2071)